MDILLVEDDCGAAACLARGLRGHCHTVDLAMDGEEGLRLALEGNHDVWVIDRMLPGRDGLSLLKRLRADGRDTPALVLSALGEVDDRVAGLRAGGDDYLVKPYAFAELVARLEALARRRVPAPDRLRVGDLVLDRLSHRVTRAGRPIRLQPKELRLLEYLMRHAGRVVTRTMLLEQVWGLHFDPCTNLVDVQISRLRRKIDQGFDPPLLHTVRRVGYRLGDG